MCTISLPQGEMFPLYVWLVYCPWPWRAAWGLLGAPRSPLTHLPFLPDTAYTRNNSKFYKYTRIGSPDIANDPSLLNQ